MNKLIIDIVLEDILNNKLRIKCSNDYIHNRLSTMSISERKERLKSLTNPFEMKDYLNLLDEKEMYEFMDAWDNPYIGEDYDKVIDQLFYYDKRIFRGYDVDKNNHDLPIVNISDFMEDDESGLTDDDMNIMLPVEANQKKIDDQIVLSKDIIDSLSEYFGDDSTRINGELNPHYHDDFWLKLNDTERRSIQEKNEKRIPLISEGIRKCDGLVEDTILYHGVGHSGLVDIHSRIGDKVKLDSFISASFRESVGQNYGKVLSDAPNLYVRFLARKGVRGVCGNKRGLSGYGDEHEYLLDKGQSGQIIGIDYDKSMITVLLD